MGVSSVKTVDRVLEDLRRAGLVKTFPRFKSEDGHVSPAVMTGIECRLRMGTSFSPPGHWCPRS